MTEETLTLDSTHQMKLVDLRKQWKSVQAATSMFWKEWVQEYLLLLTQRQKWRTQIQNFEQGNLVLSLSKEPGKTGKCDRWNRL